MSAEIIPLARRRGQSQRIVQRKEDALAPCLEGQALADELVARVDRILAARREGRELDAAREAKAARDLAASYRTEFARLARNIDDPERAA